MKERPILFNDAMVRAILAGAKTQTRRVVQPQPVVSPRLVSAADDDDDDDVCFMEAGELRRRARWGSRREPCPYGAPGDRLWVRETLRRSDVGWIYDADKKLIALDEDTRAKATGWAHHKQGDVCVSIHMPRWASRIVLEIESVRVERVQSISEDDAQAEGVEPHEYALPVKRGNSSRYVSCAEGARHRMAFARLWDSINGEREGCSWAANPWVWAVGFKVV